MDSVQSGHSIRLNTIFAAEESVVVEASSSIVEHLLHSALLSFFSKTRSHGGLLDFSLPVDTFCPAFARDTLCAILSIISILPPYCGRAFSEPGERATPCLA